MTDSSVQQIQQRLTCPVCLDRFKQPKLLPCQHTFCLTPCLVNLVDRTTRRIKCPECRMIHNLPIQGVEAFPNNITLLRFLDLDLTNVRQNDSLSLAQPDTCFQCSKKQNQNLFKCLDCEKYFCSNCKPVHLAQLKNETQQTVLNLRRLLPKLSQKVGNFEQRKTVINQNYDSIKRDITSVIERLIEDLRNRENCLHAEAEVYMQSQIRTAGLENENAEIELASVSSFCDSAETIFNRSETNDNEMALMKKQCQNFLEQMKTLNDQVSDVNKIVLTITDLNDLSNYIKSFGLLTVTNRDTNNLTNQFLSRNASVEDSDLLISNHNSRNNNQHQSPQQQRPRQRQTWNRNGAADIVLNYNNDNNSINRQDSIDRPIFGGGGPVPPPVGFNISIRTNNIQNNNRNNNLNPYISHSSRLPETRRDNPISNVVRSNTFVIEQETGNQSNQNQTRQIDINELYNVRRRARARTPMTFNIMLDEPSNNPQFDDAGFNAARPNDLLNSSVYLTTPQQPRVVYSQKTRAKQIIGKQGRNDGEFIWPVDVAINNFTNQILIADSNNHRVQIFEASGKFVKYFGRQGSRDGEFNTVSGLFVDPMSNIYVVDRLNHRVQIFDRYCRFLRSIGTGLGNTPGQLNNPWGIAVNKISEIFVCDKENNRICVFHLSGRFLRSFGTYGTNRGQFDKPCYIHITKDNKILVSDSSNNRVQVFGKIFDMNGEFLYMFGREGTNPGEFKQPRGITTDGEGFILVADSGNSRIQVFRNDGQYLTHFGGNGNDSGKFKCIEGLTVNKNGDVIICDKENSRIQIL